MTSRLTRLVARRAWSRCPDRLVVCRADGIGARGGSRRRDRGAAGVGQEALSQVLLAVPRREGGRRRLRHPAPAPQAPRTSRRASSRFARLPTERSRPIRTSSTSSGAACPTPRCPPGPTSPTRKCRISPTSLRPSPPTSRTPRMSPSPCRSRARRKPRRSQSSSGRSSTKRPAASSATARSVAATDLRLQPWWTTGAIRYARRTSRRAGPSGEGRRARTSSGR